MPYDIDADFQWFIEHQDELVRQYNGKTLAIRDGRVLGAYATVAETVARTKLPLGEYMVQLCIPGEEAYTAHVYTPGAFVQ